VDLHALPWDGGALVDAVPVAYGLDLGSRVRGVEGGRRAVVVADGRGDLPGARRDGRRVAESLRARGWQVEILSGDDATAPAVRTALERSDLLHYSGHGDFAGRAGETSALLLAGEDRLAVGDILALSSPPRFVVLSGCETGRSGGEDAVEGLGLAQAFLVAGAEQVVASVRPVGDRLASDLVDVLYGELDERRDAAGSLARAQRRLARGGEGDGFAFRALVR
jgi:CHAT domain-containing protein